jgi:hypothetical protein
VIDVIKWCNANQGFLSACLTLVYVVATIWLVRIGQRQVRLAIELERNRTRPFVVFDMFFDHFCLHARIINLGQTAAVDVSINISPKLEYVFGGEGQIPRDERTKAIPFVERVIPMLAPGREMKALVGFSKRVHQAYPELRFEGSVSYRARDGQSYREPFVIDVAAMEALAYRQIRDVEDVAKQLEEISRTLSHLATGFSKPLVRTITEEEYTAQEEAFIAEATRAAEETPITPASSSENQHET